MAQQQVQKQRQQRKTDHADPPPAADEHRAQMSLARRAQARRARQGTQNGR